MGRLATLAVLLVLLAAAAPAGGALPSVKTGHRPGPDALYAPPPAAPQLENAAPWRAEPILVSGAAAYRDGEFLYQDHLYDDHGATAPRGAGDPRGFEGFLFSPTAGGANYPDEEAFANNGADLVELRVKPLRDATAFRVTLNTLRAPERTAFTIALGGSEIARAWPHGAGVRSPAARFLTVHGDTGELRDAASGAVLSPAPSVSVDLRRRQVEVRVAHAAWNPGGATVRMAAGTGVWDRAAGRYWAPDEASAALFNVAFRFDEPMPDPSQAYIGFTIADAAAAAQAQGAWWRERLQADALRLGDVSRFAVDVDFAKLAAGTTDESRVPKTGAMNRILASRHDLGQGIDHRKVCFDIGREAPEEGARCEGRFVGQLQPYGLYVPAKPRPPKGYGLTLLLHSLSANHNQFMSSRNQSQLGDRGAGTIVATPAGRGPDGFYGGIAEADTFEVWADVARRYDLDPDWTVVTGYSMGGFGSFRLAARYPDLFARVMTAVGVPGSADDQLASLRNVPLMTWNAAGDELVQLSRSEAMVKRLDALGLRFHHRLFPGADHLTLAGNDEYGPAAEFLGEHRVDRAPPHVTYVVDPTEDSAEAQAVADHAYWLSDLRVRDAGKSPRALVDARSLAFGAGDAPVGDVERGAGALEGGERGPMPYDLRSRRWGDAPAATRADRLVVRAENLATATVDARRARLSCAPQLDVRTDGPLDLRIDCGPAPRAAAACAPRVRIGLPRVRGRRIVRATVLRNGRAVKRARGRNLRAVTIRRPTRRAFGVRVRVRTNGRRARTVTLVRRFGACRT